tara:strand:- start:17 stop:355 length:339 start_codon:yes stop_codon:yes gene_type:complete
VSIVKRFADNCLTNFIYPNKPESWHVQGMLKDKSNQIFKFDVRGMSKIDDKKLEKTGNTNSNADKMVFETTTHWIILDILEMNKYIEKYNIKDVLFDDLLNKLDWNIILTKK